MDILTVLVVVFLAGPPVVLLALVYRAVRRRRFVLVGIWAMLLLAFFGWTVHEQLMPGLGWYYSRQLTREVVGLPFGLGRPVASYEGPRSWQGDGNSVEVYAMPAAVAKRFLAAAPDLAAYPKSDKWGEGWQVRPWNRADSIASDTAYLDFALAAAPDALRGQVLDALARPASWYAVVYRTHENGGTPYTADVDFYVVDPVAGRFYVVNQNT